MTTRRENCNGRRVHFKSPHYKPFVNMFERALLGADEYIE